MTSTDHPPRELNVLHVYGYGFTMVALLVVLAWSTPAVTTLSTTVPTTLLAATVWGTFALGIALLSWWIARTVGAGVRDGFGIAPRWTRTRQRLLRIEVGLDAALVGATAATVFGVVHGVAMITNPATPGPLLLALFTTLTTAVLAEVVLLGVVATLVRRSDLTLHDLLIISIVGRVWIADEGWPAMAAAVVGGTAIALLYERTRRLTPIIVGHTMAAFVVTLTGAWATTLA